MSMTPNAHASSPSSAPTPTPVIIPATPEDAPSIKRIVDLAYTKYIEPMGMIPAPMTVNYDQLIRTTQSVYVLRLATAADDDNDDEIIGAIVITPSSPPPPPSSSPTPSPSSLPTVAESEKDESSLTINNLAITPTVQSRGYGRLLMQYAEQYARDRGLSVLTLYTNEKMTANIAWYAKIGFVETERKTVDGFKRVYFRKCIG